MTPNAEGANLAADIILKEHIEALEKYGATYDRIAQELCSMGLSNVQDYFIIAEGGELQFKPFEEIPSGAASAIKKIKEKTVITESKDGDKIYKTSTVELELYDKHKSLVTIIEQRGDKPKDNINVELTFEDALHAAILRRKQKTSDKNG